MNFLEKDLETIIWENYPACYERGLDIDEICADTYVNTLRFRQLQLGPYGVADLVNIRYEADEGKGYIQVIECKRNEINFATYGQAKRYFSAIKHIIWAYLPSPWDEMQWDEELVLIGRSFDRSGDFPFIHAEDQCCKSFIYSYEVNGLTFTEVNKDTKRSLVAQDAVARSFAQTAYNMILAADKYERGQVDLDIARMQEHGDPTRPLLVTSTGVLLNTALIERDSARKY